MPDPWEGVAADGTIVTGADRSRVPAAFEPVLADAAALAAASGASLYVYGSVANGTVRPGLSDVDLLSVDLADPYGAGQVLSDRYAGLCRGVEISPLTAADLVGDSDAAYGDRVFLRHYCVHLAGPDPSATLPAFPADARAARGFNGDIARWLQRWQQVLESGQLAGDVLGVRAARKTLLAVAALVSVQDRTWTTDRARAARRWSEIEPSLAAPLSQLLAWATTELRPAHEEVRLALAGDGIVAAVVDRFASLIGLWPEESQQDDDYQRVIASLRVAYGPGPAALRDGWAKEDFKVQERRRFLDLLRERGAASLLEVGAGPGHDSLYFKQQGLRVLCTDLSPDMVQRCTAKGLDARVADFLRLGVPPASFDAVFALNCLLHVPTPDLPRVLKALSEVLVPGGLLYVGTWGGPNQEGLVADPRYPVPRFFAFRSDEVMRQLLAGQFDILSFAAFDRGDNDRFQSFILQKTAS